MDGEGRAGQEQERRRLYALALADVVRALGLRVGLGPRYDLLKDHRVLVKVFEGCREGMVLPAEALDALARAAVYERDPSYNRYYLDAAMNAFGVRRVREAVHALLPTGTEVERAGVERADYWLGGLHRRYPGVTAADPALAASPDELRDPALPRREEREERAE
ncbi:hypothetical protein [Kitasatospora phosalacinea]|uniref:Uncharacterized protein n=1 Tax=Kitasatospora phosalacinea TaxID=2065 RepID=A0A9W6PGH6_9ACTN|nr:hypothetical protein [Kitasatospora phosalacinea]GLW54625.1 hypothetical protein Kpho01_26360 [Kitasatospora phosalacinea]